MALSVWHNAGMTDREIEQALRAYRRAEAALELRRDRLHAAIAGAVLDRGVRPTDAMRQSGYTRETVRRIVRDEEKRRAA